MTDFAPAGTSPVNLKRINRAARLAGFSPLTYPERLVVAHGKFAETIIEEDTSDQSAGGMFTFRTTHHTPLTFECLQEIGEFVNTWNDNFFSPGLVVSFDAPDDVKVTGTYALATRWGLSDSQLASAVEQALNTGNQFIEDLTECFPVARSTPPISPLSESTADQASTQPEDIPSPVTIERLQELLHSLGVTNLEKVEDTALCAWINGILFGMVTAGETHLTIRGYWTPHATETDFLRLFLTCNDNNRHSVTTTAYCHRSNTGLEVQLDAVLDISAGSTDHQLRHFLGRALRDILQGISSIAQESSGEHPVQWP